MARRKMDGTTQLRFRVPSVMVAKLQQAAAANDRSFNAEITNRLKQSLENPAPEEAFFSRELYALMRLVAQAMNAAGKLAAALASFHGSVDIESWLDNPYAYGQAFQAAMRLLEAASPAGDAAAPIVRDPDSAELGEEYLQRIGIRTVMRIVDSVLRLGIHQISDIASVKGQPESIYGAKPFVADAPRLREDLGRLIERLSKFRENSYTPAKSSEGKI
jgi:hypothetical protein